MKLLISGGTGLVGGALTKLAQEAGDSVHHLTRRPRQSSDIGWDPDANQLDARQLEGFDAVIHLAGESIASGRWTAARKELIRRSRVNTTQLLVDAIKSLNRPPQVFICASAIGYYGDRAAQVLTENAPPGALFLSEVCQAWETTAAKVAASGLRVVMTRFGVILSPDGGALQKMLTPFRFGVGGVIGNGQQFWSWITLQDTARAIRFAAATDSLSGPVNVVSPQPVTNAVFTKTLGRVLHRPTVLPMPALFARLALGEMADELLLASARVEPARLLHAGFHFDYPELEPALRQLLPH